jgi:uncharacterized protein (TIRG00374 family)
MRRFLTGLVISAGCLWWAFREFDWLSVKDALLAGNISMISLASALLLVSIPIRGYRWGLLLKPVGRVPIKLASEATLVGYFGNNALPFRLGEVLRSYFLAKQSRLGMSRIFGTVIVERVLDSLGFIALIAVLPFLGAIPPELLEPIKWAVVVGGLMAVASILVAKLDRFPLVSGRLERILDNLKLGFHGLREDSHYIPLVLTTFGIWGLYVASVHVALSGMDLNLTLSQSYLVLISASLVMAVPAAPGFVGTYHAGVIFILMNVFGIELSSSQAAAIVLHAVGFVPYTVLGATYYFKSHIDTDKLKAVLSDETEDIFEEI